MIAIDASPVPSQIEDLLRKILGLFTPFPHVTKSSTSRGWDGAIPKTPFYRIIRPVDEVSGYHFHQTPLASHERNFCPWATATGIACKASYQRTMGQSPLRVNPKIYSNL
jgi:hypothetical protein